MNDTDVPAHPNEGCAVCEECGGDGSWSASSDSTPSACPVCGGTGREPVEDEFVYGKWDEGLDPKILELLKKGYGMWPCTHELTAEEECKDCDTCRYQNKSEDEEPCLNCDDVQLYDMWRSKKPTLVFCSQGNISAKCTDRSTPFPGEGIEREHLPEDKHAQWYIDTLAEPQWHHPSCRLVADPKKPSWRCNCGLNRLRILLDKAHKKERAEIY